MNKKPLSPFQQALLDAQLEQWKDIPSEEEIEITLSEEFQANKNKLIRQAKQKKVGNASIILRRIACAAAILVILAMSAFAIPFVREGLVRIFVTETEDSFPFDFDYDLLASAPQRIEKVYKPTYSPEGFREDAIISSEWVVYMWQGDGGKMITFGQYPLSNETVRPQEDTEGLQVEGVLPNGYKVLSITNESSRMYFWTDNEYFYRLICSSSVSTDESSKMLQNIKLNENAVIKLQKQP